MKILVNKNNVQKMQEVFDAVQGKATQRVFSANYVLETSARIEKFRVKNGITKKALSNSTFYFTAHEKMPSSYRYNFDYTNFIVVYQNGKIYLIDVKRSSAYPKSTDSDYAYNLSEEAKKQLIENACFL